MFSSKDAPGSSACDRFGPSLGILLSIAAFWTTWLRVSREQMDLWAGLLLLVGVGLALACIVRLALLLGGRSVAASAGPMLSVATITVLLIAVEIFLRFGLDRYQDYFERNGATSYSPVSRRVGQSWLRVWQPESEVEWGTTEFVHYRRTNSLGLAEREIDLRKAEDEYRIIALGDSFTEGVGASYEESWVRVFEREVRRRHDGRRFTVVNAGISGSDVVFSYMLLKEKLLALEPDLVIVVVNTTDVGDVMVLGGMERFLPDGRLDPRHQGPAWEWLYGISFITRAVVHDALGYDSFFLTRREAEHERRRAWLDIESTLGEFRSLSRSRGFQLAIVLQPKAVEVEESSWPAEMRELARQMTKWDDVEVVDVLEPLRSGGPGGDGQTPYYFWPNDGHNTPEGYEVIGRAVAESLSLPGVDE